MSLFIYNIQEIARSYFPKNDYKLHNVHLTNDKEEKKENP